MANSISGVSTVRFKARPSTDELEEIKRYVDLSNQQWRRATETVDSLRLTLENTSIIRSTGNPFRFAFLQAMDKLRLGDLFKTQTKPVTETVYRLFKFEVPLVKWPNPFISGWFHKLIEKSDLCFPPELGTCETVCVSSNALLQKIQLTEEGKQAFIQQANLFRERNKLAPDEPFPEYGNL